VFAARLGKNYFMAIKFTHEAHNFRANGANRRPTGCRTRGKVSVKTPFFGGFTRQEALLPATDKLLSVAGSRSEPKVM
jgi:hypothetical protein